MNSPAATSKPHPPIKDIINELLEAERAARGLTSFEKLASALDVTASSVSRWRDGRVPTSADVLLRLAYKHWR